MTWSAFEHLGSPERALRNLDASLKRGGVLYVSIHLYTSNTGHHDIRAFTGGAGELPLWAHLRPSTQALVHPSAFLNRWRIAQWRELFARLAPGAREYRDEYRHREWYEPLLNRELRSELAAYSDEELFTVDLTYAWRKP